MEAEASGHGLTKPILHSLSEEDRERITVCPKHRCELTTRYQKLKSSCSHPSHRGEVKKLKKSQSGKQTGFGRNILGVSSFSSNRIREV